MTVVVVASHHEVAALRLRCSEGATACAKRDLCLTFRKTVIEQVGDVAEALVGLCVTGLQYVIQSLIARIVAFVQSPGPVNIPHGLQHCQFAVVFDVGCWIVFDAGRSIVVIIAARSCKDCNNHARY